MLLSVAVLVAGVTLVARDGHARLLPDGHASQVVDEGGDHGEHDHVVCSTLTCSYGWHLSHPKLQRSAGSGGRRALPTLGYWPSALDPPPPPGPPRRLLRVPRIPI